MYYNNLYIQVVYTSCVVQRRDSDMSRPSQIGYDYDSGANYTVLWSINNFLTI